MPFTKTFLPTACLDYLLVRKSYSILLIYKQLVLIICYFTCPLLKMFTNSCLDYSLVHMSFIFLILTNALSGLFACLHVITKIFFTNILLGLVVFTIILTTACLDFCCCSHVFTKQFLTKTLFGLFACLQVFSISLPTSC